MPRSPTSKLLPLPITDKGSPSRCAQRAAATKTSGVGARSRKSAGPPMRQVVCSDIGELISTFNAGKSGITGLTRGESTTSVSISLGEICEQSGTDRRDVSRSDREHDVPAVEARRQVFGGIRRRTAGNGAIRDPDDKIGRGYAERIGLARRIDIQDDDLI